MLDNTSSSLGSSSLPPFSDFNFFPNNTPLKHTKRGSIEREKDGELIRNEFPYLFSLEIQRKLKENEEEEERGRLDGNRRERVKYVCFILFTSTVCQIEEEGRGNGKTGENN